MQQYRTIYKILYRYFIRPYAYGLNRNVHLSPPQAALAALPAAGPPSLGRPSAASVMTASDTLQSEPGTPPAAGGARLPSQTAAPNASAAAAGMLEIPEAKPSEQPPTVEQPPPPPSPSPEETYPNIPTADTSAIDVEKSPQAVEKVSLVYGVGRFGICSSWVGPKHFLFPVMSHFMG